MAGRDESGTSGSGSSVVDDINAAWDELERTGGGGTESDGGGNQATAAGASATPASVAVDTPEKTGEKETTTSDGRARNPDGTFAAKAETADPTAKPAQAADPTAKPKADPAQTPTATPASAKPGNWNDIPAEDWAKVPAAVQTKVLQREQQFAGWYKNVNEHIAPLAEASKARNIPWQEGLGRLMDAQNRLDANPAEAIIWLAKSYGLNLDDVAEIAAGNLPMPAAKGQTPQNAQNGQAVPTELDQRIKRLEGEIFTSKQNVTLNEIDAFAKQPGREAFDDVIPQINMVIPGIRQANPHLAPQQILEMAYSAAVGMVPAAQAKIRQLEAKKAEAERAKQKATTAASIHLGGSPGRSANGGTSVGTVYDDLSAVWDQLAN